MTSAIKRSRQAEKLLMNRRMSCREGISNSSFKSRSRRLVPATHVLCGALNPGDAPCGIRISSTSKGNAEIQPFFTANL